MKSDILKQIIYKWLIGTMALLIVFVIMFSAQVNAEVKNISKEDTAYINRLNKTSFDSINKNPLLAKLIAEEAIERSEKINYPKGLGDAYTRLGIIEKNRSNYAQALYFHFKSLEYRKQDNDLLSVSKTYNNIGIVYQKTALYDSAVFYQLQAVEIAQQIKDTNNLIDYLNNVAINYKLNGDFALALRMHKQSLVLAELMQLTTKIYRSYHGISSTLIDSAGISANASSLYEEALLYLQIFLVSENESIDVRQYADAYNNAGLAYQYRQEPDLDSALYYFKKAIAIYSAYDMMGACVPLSNIGLLYMQRNDFGRAVAFLEESNNGALAENNKIILRTNYQSLSTIYYRLGDAKKAYDYLSKFIIYDDSLYNEEKSKAIAELQTKYESARKEQIIAQQQVAQARQEQQIARKEQTIRIIIGAGLALLIIAGLLFNRRQLKRKMEFEMQLLNDRTRISSDLHDDIGSTLGSISYFSQLANMVHKESNAAELKQLLDKIQEVSQEAVNSMSDIVWTINPKNDDAGKLILRMRKYASDLVGSSQIRYQVEFEDELTGLNFTMAQRKNIFLIFKEALYNAVKYAECSAITVGFKRDGLGLNMQITDNGKGFDVENLHTYNGNGLRNMQKRAEELNGIFQIVSKIGEGTIVAVSVPI